MQVGDKVAMIDVRALRETIGATKASFEPAGDDLLTVTWIAGNNHWINLKDWNMGNGIPVMLPKKFFTVADPATPAVTENSVREQTLAGSAYSGMTQGVSALAGSLLPATDAPPPVLPADEAATQHDHEAVDRDVEPLTTEDVPDSDVNERGDEHAEIEASLRSVFEKMGYKIASVQHVNSLDDVFGVPDAQNEFESKESQDAMREAIEAAAADFVAQVSRTHDTEKDGLMHSLMQELTDHLSDAEDEDDADTLLRNEGFTLAYRQILKRHFNVTMRLVPMFTRGTDRV